MVNYYYIGIVAGIILLLVIAIWFLLRRLKKRKQAKLLLDAKTGLPLDVLNDFNEAERRLKQEGGNPYTILWQIANERNKKKEALKNNGYSHSIEEDTRQGSGNSQDTGADRTSQPGNNTGTQGTINLSQPAGGDIQGDRELERGQGVPIQFDSISSEGKRKPKRNWAKFD